eukprot:12885668-Prorocentrum_lima.AAC.1
MQRGVRDFTPREREMYKGKKVPCTMIFVKKFCTPSETNRGNRSESWKARSYMVICRSSSRGQEDIWTNVPDARED